MYADVGAVSRFLALKSRVSLATFKGLLWRKKMVVSLLEDFPTDPIRTASEVVMDTSALCDPTHL